MATPEELNLAQFKEVYQQTTEGIPGAKHEGKLFGNARRAAETIGKVWDDINMKLPERILNHKVTWYGFDGKTQPKGQRNTVTLAATIGWLDSALRQLITGQAAILAAVKASSAQQGIDPAKLEQMIQDAIKESIGTYELRRVDAAKQSEEDAQ